MVKVGILLQAIVCAAACGHCPPPAGRFRDGLTPESAALFRRGDAILRDDLKIVSPADGATIPRNLRRPLVVWEAPAGSSGPFLLELKSAGRRLDVYTTGRRWRPEGEEFTPFLDDGKVSATVFMAGEDRTSRSAPARLIVSEHALDQGVAYRLVPPLFDPLLPNALGFLAIDTGERTNLARFEGTCVGCHAYAAGASCFNAKRGGDRRLVGAGRRDGAVRMKQLAAGNFSFAALSPDGRSVAVVYNPVGNLSVNETVVEPFDYPYRSADIYVGGTGDGGLAPLPGANDPDVVEDMPAWSADGERIVFSRYRLEGKEGEAGIRRMDLYEVPFNGGRGGAAVPVKGASADGLCQYFPKYSPDGKWISFCRGDCSKGVYARRSSDIYLLPASGGEAVRLGLNAEDAMDSWHAWSADGRWLVFSSNRGAGDLTALYLAYIDGRGRSHPPLELAAWEGMKANVPQFVPAGFDPAALGGLKDFIEGLFAAPGP